MKKMVNVVAHAHVALVEDPECAATSVKMVNVLKAITVVSSTAPTTPASQTLLKLLLLLKESPGRRRPKCLAVNVLCFVTTVPVIVVMNAVSNMVRTILVSPILNPKTRVKKNVRVAVVVVVPLVEMVVVMVVMTLLPVTLPRRLTRNVTTTSLLVVVSVMPADVCTVVTLLQWKLKKLMRFATIFRTTNVASVVFAVVSTSLPLRVSKNGFIGSDCMCARYAPSFRTSSVESAIFCRQHIAASA